MKGKTILLFIFRERGKEKEGEKHDVWNRLLLSCPQLGTWPTTQACAPTGNWTGDPSFHRLVVLNPLSHTHQGDKNYFLNAKSLGRCGLVHWASFCKPEGHPSPILRQGTRLGCRFCPWSRHVRKATDRCFSLTLMFLSLSFSFPSPLSKSKIKT